ncbi:CoA-transferase family III [Xylariaceae sp. FL0016]|nr:CoA-transferase family III [Xylariaceae sp. FL0016]
MNRQHHNTCTIVHELWHHLNLPASALDSLSISPLTAPAIRSSFKIDHLAQSTIALSALTAALVGSTRAPKTHHAYASSGSDTSSSGDVVVPRVTVNPHHALAEFQAERLYRLNGQPPVSSWGPIGGLHRTRDGHVRVHDNFPHHRDGALALLGLPMDADRAAVAARLREREALAVESAAAQRGVPVYKLRSFEAWDRTPQATVLDPLPVTIRKVGEAPPRRCLRPGPGPPPAGDRGTRCLAGLRVLELTRVIAGPVAGKTLAAHGADVVRVVGPGLPDLPALDVEFDRGKRVVALDLDVAADEAAVRELARGCDVLVQSFRPGSLAARGLGSGDLAGMNPGIVVADLSAFGARGPWGGRRGFDSLVQTCTGLNVAEAEALGAKGERARPLPCQALDHAAGFLLAAGVSAAVYRRSVEGGSWVVEVSLAGVGKYLRSLGRYEGWSGAEDAGQGCEESWFEVAETGFGEMRYVRHAAEVEGCDVGWDILPKPLGLDEARWLV